MTSITSPSFHVSLDPQGRFPSSENRMIPKGLSSIAPEPSNRFLTCFKKCLCFGSNVGQLEENKRANHVFKEYLKQEYGTVVALLSTRMANIDLFENEQSGTPLYDFDLVVIKKNADELKLHLMALKIMIKQVVFSEEMRLSRRIIGQKTDKTSAPDLEAKDICCIVHKRNGKWNNFKSLKLKPIWNNFLLRTFLRPNYRL